MIRVKALLNDNKKSLLSGDNTLLSKSNELWNTLAAQIPTEMKGSVLYTIACEWRREMGIQTGRGLGLDVTAESLNSSGSFVETDRGNFEEEKIIIKVPRKDVENLIVVTTVRKVKNGKSVRRPKRVLEQFVWEDYITRQIWGATRRCCGYNFKGHYISMTETKGNCTGKIFCCLENLFFFFLVKMIEQYY